MAFIQIKNLKFSYPEKKVLDIDSLSVEKGEKVFLFGPSGAGKTTFLEILSGILQAQDGEVSIAGKNLTKLGASERDQFRAKNVSYVFQSFNLIPYLSVEENIILPMYLQAKSPRREDVLYLVQTLGIEDILQSKATDISLGQQQRVAVARALLGKPELILADEPTSALDFDAREKFLRLLFTLCDERKTTLIFVSHDRSLQDLFSRRIDLQSINRGVL